MNKKIIYAVLGLSLMLNLFFIAGYLLTPKIQNGYYGKGSTFECRCLGSSYLSYPLTDKFQTSCLGIVFACEYYGP